MGELERFRSQLSVDLEGRECRATQGRLEDHGKCFGGSNGHLVDSLGLGLCHVLGLEH